MKIRKITPGDDRAYRDLYLQLGRETPFRLYEAGERPEELDNFREEIGRFLDNPKSMIFVAEQDGALVGYLQAIGRTQRRICHVVSINVAILQAYTGQGVGGQLFAALEDWARESGIRRLDLTVMENNAPARKLYERLGFSREGIKRRSMFVDGRYIDEIYMAKWLDGGQISFEIAVAMEDAKNRLFTEGLCVARRGGEEIFYHAIACDYDSVFDLASVTKLVTGTVILRLVGTSRLQLDARLDDIFRAAPLQEETRRRFRGITLRQLLSHASGLPAWYPFYTAKGGFWDVLEKILRENPEEAPRASVYSDINFLLLGEIIRYRTGRPLRENLEELNALLGTHFQYLPVDKKRCVPTEYGNRVEMRMVKQRGLEYAFWRDTGQRIRGEVDDGNCFYYWKGIAGHAGIFGTAADLLRLGELYLRKGGSYLPPALVEEALRDQGGGRGLAWDLRETFPRGAGHTGFTGTALWICPEKDMAAVLLCSRLALDGPPDMQDLRKEIFTELYNMAADGDAAQ